jgi:predicted DNA-binding protein
MSGRSIPIVFRIPHDMHWHLTQLARRENRTVNALVRGILAEYIKSQTGVDVSPFVPTGRVVGEGRKTKAK